MYLLTCIILFVHRWAQSLQVKFSDILSSGWIDDCKLLKTPAYIFNFYLFIASANSFFSQVSPLFQKLEADQIEALKKKFGGQQVFDVYDT